MHKKLEDSLTSVLAVRLELETDARTMHPAENITYPVDAPRVSAATLSHALAGSSENIEID
ncbi:MAG: hypothetical protein WBD40_09175 [Tepidisphaeraceae bacterium]